jgi:hypothetical protein
MYVHKCIGQQQHIHTYIERMGILYCHLSLQNKYICSKPVVITVIKYKSALGNMVTVSLIYDPVVPVLYISCRTRMTAL